MQNKRESVIGAHSARAIDDAQRRKERLASLRIMDMRVEPRPAATISPTPQTIKKVDTVVVRKPQATPKAQAAVPAPVKPRVTTDNSRLRPSKASFGSSHHSDAPAAEFDRNVSRLKNALKVAQKELDKERRKKQFFKRTALFMTAAVLLLSTGYVGFDTWMTNSRLKAVAGPTTSQEPDTKDSAPADTVKFAGDVESEKVSEAAVAAHSVPADQPRAIYIKKIGIAARVISVGEKDGAIDAPKNIYDAGWYNQSAKPGQSGATFIDGHSPESGLNYGLFAKLDRVGDGDGITIEMGDGTKREYIVKATEITPYKEVDMKKALTPYGGAAQGLNIITCHGKWIESEKTLDHRLIVYAVPA